MSLITFEHVTKRYADKVAVGDFNLQIEPGELFVLVGPSGSGKTTALKMINRLVVPEEGTITFDGQNIAEMDARSLRLRIGYVLQQIALFPTMTVGQNIALIPELKQWPKAKVAQAVTDLLKAVGLPEAYRKRRPSALSGGEQQRVGIIRALASQPPVVLMDEPFSALDPLSRTQLQDLVLQLHRDLKLTILFVTHDMNEALKLGQRIGVMKAGELVQVGTPQQIAQQPKNAFVANFFAATSAPLLQTPLAALQPFGRATSQPADMAGSAYLTAAMQKLAQANHVTVSGKHGNFEVDAKTVVAYLAAQTGDDSPHEAV